MKKGFTLIELLIVVAIIAILAAIAVPNFLEAQTRAKTSRVLSDLRTINTAFETYRIDHNNIPPHGMYNRTTDGKGLIVVTAFRYTLDPVIITTPVSYLSSEAPTLDVFQAKLLRNVPKTIANADTWPLGRLTYVSYLQDTTLGVISPTSKRLGLERFGGWRMSSAGPDGAIHNQFLPPEGTVGSRTAASKIIPYDASNGTISVGDIFRTGLGEQRQSYL